MNNKLLVCVIGPTAIGKTKVTIELAKHYNTEIISCDSRQLYKEMSIGTAVPSAKELQEVPHHIIQNKSIHENFSVGDYEIEANSILSNLFKAKDIVFLTGGSGLFERALTKGLDVFPNVPDEARLELEQQLKNNGIAFLQNLLKEKDLAYFNQVDIHNARRLIRALEITLFTKKPYSTYLNQKKIEKKPFTILKIGLTIPREQLYTNINNRVEQMLASGLLNEVKNLIDFKNINPLNTVGYKELFDFLENKTTLETATEEIKKNTRHYAKRQMTWYNKEEGINWCNPVDINQMKDLINNCVRIN